MKLIAGIAVIALMSGCASAEQRIGSKINYRQSQVNMVEAQERARTETDSNNDNSVGTQSGEPTP